MEKRKKNAVTLEKIAAKLNVSKSTVSKALSNATDINLKTKERILECAAEMGYISGRERPNSQKNVVIFICSSELGTANQTAYDYILGFQTAAKENGYGVNVVNVDINGVASGNYIENIADGRAAGCFFIGFTPDGNFVREAESSDTAMVILNGSADSRLAMRISADTSLGYEMLISHLYKQGHRKIAFLGQSKNRENGLRREEAFFKALSRYKLRQEPVLTSYTGYDEDFNPEKVLTLMKEGATAVCCASDALAVEAIRALQDAGVRVPQDVSVAGFDAMPFARYFTPSVTSVSQNRIHIGKYAFLSILQIRNGMYLTRCILRPELVTGNSTGSPE